MIDIDRLFFEWLVDVRAGPSSPSYERLCWMLHQNTFKRRVGNDINRADDGIYLRKVFLEHHEKMNFSTTVVDDFMAPECSWFEMMVGLSEALDFLYDGGVKERMIELITNMGLLKVLFSPGNSQPVNPYDEVDQELVFIVTRAIDNNQFDAMGHGGLFPLMNEPKYDQRTIEIWSQGSAYFVERLEGILWTSTN